MWAAARERRKHEREEKKEQVGRYVRK